MNKLDYKFRLRLIITTLVSVLETENILRAEGLLKSLANAYFEFMQTLEQKEIKNRFIYKNRHISASNNINSICKDILKTNFNSLEEMKHLARTIFDNTLTLYKEDKNLLNLEFINIDKYRTEILFKLYFNKENILLTFPKLTIDIKRGIVEELEHGYTDYITKWFKELKDLKTTISYRGIKESDQEEILKHQIALRALGITYVYKEFLEDLQIRIKNNALKEVNLETILQKLIEDFGLIEIFENPLKELKEDKIICYEKLNNIKENKSSLYDTIILDKYKDVYKARIFKNVRTGLNASLISSDTKQDILNMFDTKELYLNDIITIIQNGEYIEHSLEDIIRVYGEVPSIDKTTLIDLLNYFEEKRLSEEVDELRVQLMNRNKEISIAQDKIAVEERYIDTENNFTVKEIKGVKKSNKGFWVNDFYHLDTNESVTFCTKEIMFRDILDEQDYIEYDKFYTMDRHDRPAIGYEIISNEGPLPNSIPLQVIGMLGNKKVNCYFYRLIVDKEDSRRNMDLDAADENESILLVHLMYLILYLEHFSTSHSKLYREWVYRNMVTDEGTEVLKKVFTSTPVIRDIRDNAKERLRNFTKGVDFENNHPEAVVILNLLRVKDIMIKEIEIFGELQEALNKATEIIHALEIE